MEGKLKIPPEAEDAKNLALYMWVEIGRVRLGDIAFDPDSADVWHGNKLAEYLWTTWESELAKRGFTQRRFMRLMSYTTDDVLLWAYERIPWRELVDKIVELINGPVGKAIIEGGRP
jgi:hypothetical protein